MKKFYITGIFDFCLLLAIHDEDTLQDILRCSVMTKKPVTVLAVDGVGIGSLSDADYEDLNTREDAKVLFCVEAESKEEASQILQGIVSEIYEEE